MAILKMRGVSKRRGKGIHSLQIRIPEFTLEEAGEVLISGESGSGKSTLLNLIAGILAPDSGSIEIKGTDITGLSESRRDRFRAEHIGCVYQTFNLLMGFSARENVLLGSAFAAGHGNDKRADHLLQRLGLADKHAKKPSELSVGEQQRVAVARALMSEPVLLLADEPTANLDHDNAVQVIAELRELSREAGTSLLLVTHDARVLGEFNESIPIEDILELETAADVNGSRTTLNPGK